MAASCARCRWGFLKCSHSWCIGAIYCPSRFYANKNANKTLNPPPQMLVRLALLGIQFFFPITILACVVLLPTYTSQNYLAEEHADGQARTCF